MAMRVLYLDVDDEITSAASRIRSAEEIRIAVVLPYGSRVATSRINFRLLARDATLNGKRLSIIAGDAATRALAASAGLPIFASVAEYESTLEEEKAERADTNGSGGGAGAGATGAAIAATSAATSAADAAPSESGEIVDAPPERRTVRSTRGASRRKAAPPAAEDTAVTGTAAEDAAAIDAGAAMAISTPIGSIPAGDEPLPAGTPAATPAASSTVASTAGNIRQSGGFIRGAPSTATRSVSQAHPVARAPSVVPAARVIADSPSRPAILDRPFGPFASRMPIVIGAAVLALALIVGVVGAYLLLPSATVVITPRQSAIGPIELRITASPSATEPDQEAKVVPAISRDVEVDASQTFSATGKRVEEKAATGVVRFDNFNPVSSNTIARGAVVSTQGGERFRTDRTLTVPAASFDPATSTITPSRATVSVTAVDPGTDGNVGPNTITRIPRGENSTFLDVTNPNATKGGAREEFPRVARADVDKATAALRDQLAASFQDKLTDPALGGERTTVFPQTAVLGEATFTVDPTTLVGDEVPSFELGANASGTVLAVDESVVASVATADIATHVEPGYALVDGSSDVATSPGVVEGGVITFPATITATQVLQVDPAAVEAEIRGKSLAEAQTILQRYGTPEVSVWPDWVGAIPTIDARVDVRVNAGAEATP